MSSLIEADPGLSKTAVTVNDNLDTRSVCSSVCSSMKNTELIIAAFNSHPLTLTIEEENENSTEVSFSAGSFTNSRKSLNNSNSTDLVSDRTNNSTEYLIEETTDDKNAKGDSHLLNDLLEDTIADVASGSISEETTKIIAEKQKLMLKHTKTQEKHYYKLKKLREKEQKKKALKRLENTKRIERGKALKKTGKGQKNPDASDFEDQANLQEQLIISPKLNSPKSEPKTAPGANSEQPIFKIKKKLNSVNLIDQKLNKRKFTKAKKNLNKNLSNVVRQKPGPKPKVKIEDPELIFEPTTDTFYEDYDEENDDYMNELKDTNNVELFYEAKNSDTQTFLKRQCLVCKRQMHQNKLYDHCLRHYNESPKCSSCDKVSTNSSNYVTHLLSHLPAQFFCQPCDKWFRQPIVFKRHQTECTSSTSIQNNPLVVNTGVKRKAASQNETLPDPATNIDRHDIKRSRRGRQPSHLLINSAASTKKIITQPDLILSIPVEPVKRKQGRPRKNPIVIENATRPSGQQMSSTNGNGKFFETHQGFSNSINQDINKLASLEEATAKKSISSLKTKLKKTKSERASSVIQQRKTSSRLLSISSAVSSSSSADINNGIDKQQKKQSNKFHESSPINSFELNDETVSENMDDIDDVVVSDYEIDSSNNNIGDELARTDHKTVGPVTVNSDQEKTLPETAMTSVKQLNLTACATYKVKIQLRRPSNNTSKQTTKEPLNDSLNISIISHTAQTPSKLLNNVFLNSNPLNTPAKSELTSNNPLNNPNITNTNSHEFSCPECDKKFVSYYGLFAHYDNHPTLAVSCQICQISFENHQALIAHNAKQHPHFHADFNEFKSGRLNAESSKSGGELSKKVEKSTSTIITTTTASIITSTTTSNRSSKQSLNFHAKSKSQTTDLVTTPTTDLHANDLSALPSIMTRTSRLTNNDNKAYNSNNNSISNAVSLRTAAAISNHNLPFKTTGFADLSFIDFSCMNFPRIAQNYCELWPRKPASASSEYLQQQLQPLHNYSCNHCGYYFPSVASLRLHTMKKHLASTELTQSFQSEIKPACPLFMTNSKSMCYEKCLDEIITRIEQEQERTENEAEAEFLGLVGLMPVINFKKQSTSDFVSSSTGKAKQLNDQLIDYISPIHVASSDGLLDELRKMLLNTNTNFIVELDRWKLMHTSCLDKVDHYSSKIHLKPPVNLSRPLLIKSKKLKRNLTKRSLMKTKSDLAPASPRHQPFRSSQLAQAIKAAPIVSSVQESKVTNPKEATKTIAVVPNEIVSTTTTLPKLSKPFFTATSGGFSGGAIQQKNNNHNQLKKRKQEQVQTKPEHKNSKRKQQPIQDTPTSGSLSPSSIYQVIVSDNSKFETTDEIIQLNETEDDDEFDYYDEDEKDNRFELPKFSKPEKPAQVNAHSNATSNSDDIITFMPVIKSTQSNKSAYRKIAPQPPPLYKAPQINTAIFTSAANSSILANASGMNNNLAKKNMPKLLPANIIAPTNKNRDNYEILMPKLKPMLPTSTAVSTVKARNAPSKPPQLIKSSPIQQNTSKSQGKSANSSNKFHQPPSQTVPLKGSPQKKVKQKNNADTHTANSTSSASLKCKFCFQIFEGQPEFFQHVIKSHPRMLEQRLNRSNSTTTQATTSTEGNSKSSSKVALGSNGNSNHSTSSVSSSSNASNHPK